MTLVTNKTVWSGNGYEMKLRYSESFSQRPLESLCQEKALTHFYIKSKPTGLLEHTLTCVVFFPDTIRANISIGAQLLVTNWAYSRSHYRKWGVYAVNEQKVLPWGIKHMFDMLFLGEVKLANKYQTNLKSILASEQTVVVWNVHFYYHILVKLCAHIYWNFI